MMLLFLDQILSNAQRHRGHTIIRKLHCGRCSTVLAIEINTKLGQRIGQEYVVKDKIVTKYGIDALFAKESWFGNKVVCPQCLTLVTLPIDKPLNAENIALPKEVKDGNKNKAQTIAA